MDQVEDRIARALADRAEQRPFAERLAATWDALTAQYQDLVESVRVLDAGMRGSSAVPDRDRHLGDGIVRVLRPSTAGGPAEADRLAARLDEVRAQLATLLGRVSRETVNIGVIGITKAGKSTVLRTITDLPETVIPTTRIRPTTAAASRIYHTPGTPSAVLDLHTWETYRDAYLAPLHAEAKLGSPPRTADEFRDRRYAPPGTEGSGTAGTDDVVRKLIVAQESLDSYLALLRQQSRTATVDFADLRAYVAYPDPDRGDRPYHRPYHAVRSVRIEQKFLDGATRLGLIDLPGAGEAGLDVDTHFVRRVKDEIDLLLMVKRPGVKDAGWFGPDGDVLRLADAARGGAALEDYFLIFLNRDTQNDPEGEFFAAAREGVGQIAADRSIQVLAATADDRADVLENLLVPALGQLATKLGRMDRAAIDTVLESTGAVAADVRRFADDLVLRTERFARELPNQEFLLRDQVADLLNRLAVDLRNLRNDYDAVAAAGAADEALMHGITDAVAEARAWVANGFGAGSKTEWLAAIDGAYTRGFRYAVQDQYYAAKAEITTCFSKIDTSLEESVGQLLDQAAAILRKHLTPLLVPQDSGIAGLKDIALDRRAVRLYDALEQLGNLKIDYGSIVLRVTRPIIREIDRDDPASGTRPARTPSGGQGAAVHGRPAAPPPKGPEAATSAVRPGYRWETDESGVRRRMPVGPAVQAPPPVPPPPTQHFPQPPPEQSTRTVGPPPAAAQGLADAGRLRQGAESLYDELSHSVRTAIDDLEAALRGESYVMVKALAAAVDKFFDAVLRTNEISRDYELLCGPDRREIWPTAFDGGSARLAADLSSIAEQARHVVARTSAAGDFRMTLRSPQPSAREL